MPNSSRCWAIADRMRSGCCVHAARTLASIFTCTRDTDVTAVPDAPASPYSIRDREKRMVNAKRARIFVFARGRMAVYLWGRICARISCASLTQEVQGCEWVTVWVISTCVQLRECKLLVRACMPWWEPVADYTTTPPSHSSSSLALKSMEAEIVHVHECTCERIDIQTTLQHFGVRFSKGCLIMSWNHHTGGLWSAVQ